MASVRDERAVWRMANRLFRCSFVIPSAARDPRCRRRPDRSRSVGPALHATPRHDLVGREHHHFVALPYAGDDLRGRTGEMPDAYITRLRAAIRDHEYVPPGPTVAAREQRAARHGERLGRRPHDDARLDAESVAD